MFKWITLLALLCAYAAAAPGRARRFALELGKTTRSGDASPVAIDAGHSQYYDQPCPCGNDRTGAAQITPLPSIPIPGGMTLPSIPGPAAIPVPPLPSISLVPPAPSIPIPDSNMPTRIGITIPSIPTPDLSLPASAGLPPLSPDIGTGHRRAPQSSTVNSYTKVYRVSITETSHADYQGFSKSLLDVVSKKHLVDSQFGNLITSSVSKLGGEFSGIGASLSDALKLPSFSHPRIPVHIAYSWGKEAATNKLSAALHSVKAGSGKARDFAKALLEYILESGALDVDKATTMADTYGIHITATTEDERKASGSVSLSAVTFAEEHAEQLPPYIVGVLDKLVHKNVISKNVAADILASFDIAPIGVFENLTGTPISKVGSIEIVSKPLPKAKFFTVLAELIANRLTEPDTLSSAAKLLLELGVDNDALSVGEATDLSSKLGIVATIDHVKRSEDDAIFQFTEEESSNTSESISEVIGVNSNAGESPHNPISPIDGGGNPLPSAPFVPQSSPVLHAGDGPLSLATGAKLSEVESVAAQSHKSEHHESTHITEQSAHIADETNIDSDADDEPERKLEHPHKAIQDTAELLQDGGRVEHLHTQDTEHKESKHEESSVAVQHGVTQSSDGSLHVASKGEVHSEKEEAIEHSEKHEHKHSGHHGASEVADNADTETLQLEHEQTKEESQHSSVTHNLAEISEGSPRDDDHDYDKVNSEDMEDMLHDETKHKGHKHSGKHGRGHVSDQGAVDSENVQVEHEEIQGNLQKVSMHPDWADHSSGHHESVEAHADHVQEHSEVTQHHEIDHEESHTVAVQHGRMQASDEPLGVAVETETNPEKDLDIEAQVHKVTEQHEETRDSEEPLDVAVDYTNSENELGADRETYGHQGHSHTSDQDDIDSGNVNVGNEEVKESKHSSTKHDLIEASAGSSDGVDHVKEHSEVTQINHEETHKVAIQHGEIQASEEPLDVVVDAELNSEKEPAGDIEKHNHKHSGHHGHGHSTVDIDSEKENVRVEHEETKESKHAPVQQELAAGSEEPIRDVDHTESGFENEQVSQHPESNYKESHKVAVQHGETQASADSLQVAVGAESHSEKQLELDIEKQNHNLPGRHGDGLEADEPLEISDQVEIESEAARVEKHHEIKEEKSSGHLGADAEETLRVSDHAKHNSEKVEVSHQEDSKHEKSVQTLVSVGEPSPGPDLSYTVTITRSKSEDNTPLINKLLDAIVDKDVFNAGVAGSILAAFGIHGDNKFSGSALTIDSIKTLNARISGKEGAANKFVTALTDLLSDKISGGDRPKNYFPQQLIKILLELILNNKLIKRKVLGKLVSSNGVTIRIVSVMESYHMADEEESNVAIQPGTAQQAKEQTKKKRPKKTHHKHDVKHETSYDVTITSSLEEDHSLFVNTLLDKVVDNKIFDPSVAASIRSAFGGFGISDTLSLTGIIDLTTASVKTLTIGGVETASKKFLSAFADIMGQRMRKSQFYTTSQLVKILLELLLDNAVYDVEGASDLAAEFEVTVSIHGIKTTHELHDTLFKSSEETDGEVRVVNEESKREKHREKQVDESLLFGLH